MEDKDHVVIQIEGHLNTRGNSSNVDENVGADDDKERKQPPKVITLVLLQSTWWFICIVSLFIATLSTKTLLGNLILLGLDLWKWFAFVLIICCTPLLIARFVHVVILFIEMNFVMSEKRKVLYFVCGTKSSVVSFLCSSSILLAWIMLIDWDIKGTTSLIHLITNTLATFVIGVASWMFKIVILKVLSCSFHDKKFFNKIQLLIFHQYVLQTLLWGPSLVSVPEKCTGKICNNVGVQPKWIKEPVVNMLGGKRLFSICDALDKKFYDETLRENDTKSLVSRIFKNLAKNNPREINEADLLKLMKQEHIPNVLKLFEGSFETKRITQTSLHDWTEKVCYERKTLVHLLNDTNTVIKELNNLVSLILLISIAIIWLLLMGFETNKELLSILSSVFLVVFTFGNINNTIWQGIMFVFVRHPFDKGDFCEIDNEQMIVEEIRIMTTIFLKKNNDKKDYPNSDLAIKSITNLTRSPSINDIVELLVNTATSVENIATLKFKVNEFLGSKPEIEFKEILDGKVKFGLHATHAINCHHYMDKDKLVVELKKLFEELGIKYLPVQ